jgi:hypothetical protein
MPLGAILCSLGTGRGFRNGGSLVQVRLSEIDELIRR